MKLLKKYNLLIFIIFLAVGAVVYYKYFRTDNQISYITEPVRRQDITKVVNATGEIKAIELVTVGAQASGKIEKLHVVVGQKIKEGDLIAEIDSTTQQNDVDINKSRLSSYEAQLAAAKVTLEVADKQYQRMQFLKEKDASSEEDLENARSTLASAKSKVVELEASIKETKVSLSTAETNLGYTRITAPLDGTIVSVPVKQGQTVNAAMNTPTIVQIADLSRMEILVEISEGDIINIQPGLKVTYAILADLEKIQEANLQSIDPGLTLLTNGEYGEVVDSNEAIYYYGRLVVPNENGKLRIGMTTQTVIYVDAATNVLVVPAVAVKGNNSDRYVEVLSYEGSQRRKVVTGITDGLNVEIKSGLHEGEEIILAQLSSSEISDKTNSMRRGPRGL